MPRTATKTPAALRSYLPRLKKTVVLAAQHDFVGVWFVVWYLKDRFPQLDGEPLRKTALHVVADLLKDGRLVAGLPRDDASFVPWEGSREQLLKRIEREWRKLGRDPKMHELVLFDAPATGDHGPA